VITEGEAGDLFFLIESGVVEVSREGRPEGTQGPGEGFGEIALLHDVPRMATITARTECTLLVLSREDFLEAVTGHTRSNETAHSVAAGHLDGGLPGR
ncbi:MAG: cyclic nucleotide-binding domain-containing protein, partial [Solirubrobacterales bacterium]